MMMSRNSRVPSREVAADWPGCRYCAAPLIDPSAIQFGLDGLAQRIQVRGLFGCSLTTGFFERGPGGLHLFVDLLHQAIVGPEFGQQLRAPILQLDQHRVQAFS